MSVDRETTQTSASLPQEFVRAGVDRIETDVVDVCPVCGAEEFETYAVGFDYELLTCSNEWRFVCCQQCGHVWLNPRPAISALPVIYPPTYYAYNYDAQINGIARRGKKILDRFKMRWILSQVASRPASFADVGCGNGRFLKAMEKQGLSREKLYGLELDEGVVRNLRKEGYQVFCERVEDCQRIGRETIDLATMFHVIEHVDDPGTVIRAVREWLTPGGVFAVETPNVDSLDARLFSKGVWGGYHIPRHWNLFRSDTLSRLFANNGLEVIATKYQTGHSFWMYSFHHSLRYAKRPWRRLSKQFDPYKGLAPLVFFTGFDKIRAAMGFRTSAMLMLARKPVLCA